MTYSHYTGLEPGQVKRTGKELMGSNILYRSVHTGLRQGNEPDPLSAVMPVPFPVPVPVPRSVNEPLVSRSVGFNFLGKIVSLDL